VSDADKIAVLQMRSGLDPRVNAAFMADAAREAAQNGATMMFTPEMSGMVDRDRGRAAESIRSEEDDQVLERLRETARENAIWIAIGSLAIDKGEGRWANRAFVIDDRGEITARYDKLHMFDVELGDGDDWRESNAYDAGNAIAVVDTPVGRLGLTICYDIRFPALYDALGRARCDIIAIPAAFTVPTGKAHWHVMQRARAIEASAYVVAAAQSGDHEDGRRTYGHSLVVDPWGEVVLDLGDTGSGLGYAVIDRNKIEEVRGRLPSLANRRVVPDLESR